MDNEWEFEVWSEGRELGVRMAAPAMRKILLACEQSGNREAGGVLVGRYSADRRLASLLDASLPGSDTRSGWAWLVRGVRGLHVWLASLWEENRHYVGEWHFHPYSSPNPSRTDLRQMRNIARDEQYQCTEPIMLIIGGDPQKEWVARLEVHTSAGRRYRFPEQRPAQRGSER